MKGYPKHVATVQDFQNLLAMPEHKNQALADLKAIYLLEDDKVTRTISINEETKETKTEEIYNPLTRWKQKGFVSRETIAELIRANGGKV